MPSPVKTPHFVKRDRRHASIGYRTMRADREIGKRVGVMAKRHKMKARGLIKRFYEASEGEILRYLQCERKIVYHSLAEAEAGRHRADSGHKLTSYQCRWNIKHFHLGNVEPSSHQEVLEVQSIRALLKYRRELELKAS